MGSGSLLAVLAKNWHLLAGPFMSLVYPLYSSIKAIETKSAVDDQQWLTYWVLHSLITLFELTFAQVLEWLPIWSYFKLAVICWLVLPNFNGAAYVYENLVRPWFVNGQTVNIWYVPQKKGVFKKQGDFVTEVSGAGAFEKLKDKKNNVPKAKKSDDFLSAVDKLGENGRGALKKLTDKVKKSTKPKKAEKHVHFNEPERGTEPTLSNVVSEADLHQFRNMGFTIFDDDNRYHSY